jgi:hypothetical protein
MVPFLPDSTRQGFQEEEKMKKDFLSGLILAIFLITGCLATGQQGSQVRSDRSADQSIQSDRAAATDAQRQRTRRDAAPQREEASAESAKPQERKAPAERVSPEQQAPAEAAKSRPGMQRMAGQITLHPANSTKDPYSLAFRLNVTAPGRISMLVRKPEKGVRLEKNQNLFRISIVDERGFIQGTNRIKKKYVLRDAYFKYERGLLEYSVDQVELDQMQKKYLVLITNFYTKNPYATYLQILYPALSTTEEQKATPVQMQGVTVEDD